MEEIYQSIEIKRIIPDASLPGSVYLYLNGHFVHYKSHGDLFPVDKHNLFILKKITHLFVLREDAEKFEDWYKAETNKESKELLKAVGEKNKEHIKLRQELKGDLYDLFQSDLEDESIDKCLEATRSVISKVNEDVQSEKILKKLINYGHGLADHSLNVAYLSVYLAQQLGYNHQIILENIFLGAVFHDFGKTRIDPKYFEDENSDGYEKAMASHPTLGKRTLLAKSVFPDEVLNIVEQHHERHDGLGYPKGIKGARIYDLAKIVAIANAFFDFMDSSDGDFLSKKKMAIYLIENDKGHMFDPKKAESCVKYLKALS